VAAGVCSEQARALVPPAVLPTLVRRRIDALWDDENFRAAQTDEMRFLLEHTDRAGEIPVLARAYAEQTMLRSYLRWHPRAITRQRVRGAEWLTTRRDPARAVVLSFAHHARYDGLFGSLARVGVAAEVLTLPAALEPGAPATVRQHIRVVRRGATTVPALGGTEAVVARMRPGAVLAIASDVPGRTPVQFLGRRVLGSFGAARVAVLSDSPVVVVTSHRDAHGGHLRVHPPLEPRAFPDAAALLEAVLARHAAAVLAWPEAVDTPLARWGSLDALVPGVGDRCA
jgi:lauroyl/myristoyl acyltransferase